MGNLIKEKKSIDGPKVSADELVAKEKGQDFYEELDIYRKRGGWLPVLLLLVITVALFVFVAWYLKRPI